MPVADGPATLPDLLADIRAAPAGPKVAAFFDFDGTLIDGYSAVAFARDRIRRLQVSPVEAAQLLVVGLRGVTTEEDFARFVRLSFRAWAGRAEDELSELGERLFVQQIAGSVYPEAWQLVRAHQRQGHTVVIASSASRFQVEPTANALGVAATLCTEAEVAGGILTGRVAGDPLWRAGKAAAVHGFAAEHDVDLPASFAYSNGAEDVPFLSTVGNPRAVNPHPGLAATAAERGWPAIRFDPRGLPGPERIVRTAAAYAGTLTAFGVGAAIGLVGGGRRGAVDLATSIGGDIGLALARVELAVTGQEHLWERRPAVFVFNHQSQLDLLILCKLLRGGFTGVAKKELARSPTVGPFFRFAQVAFVDRSSSAQARAALAPAVDRLRAGTSLVIAPEGTRSPTPELGAFRKGAFHLAMQAKVPIVPIVIRNAGELMWRGARTIRSGTIDVAVAPPVDVTGWRVRTLATHVADVRQVFLDALADWPDA